MPVIVHLLLVTLATLFGWDLLRRASPVAVPGVIARIVIAAIATVLWLLCPLPLLAGMAVVGVLMIVGRFVSVEPHYLWGKDVKDWWTKRRQEKGQKEEQDFISEKQASMGKRYEVTDKIGERIPKL